MNYTEASKILETLREMFPHWKWEPAEGKANIHERIWMGKLYSYDYNIALQALENIYAYGMADFQRQLLPAFLKEADRIVASFSETKEHEPIEAVLLYTLQDEENPKWKQGFFHQCKMPKNTEAIFKEAQKMQTALSLLYNRNIKIIRNWESDHVEETIPF